MKYQIAVVVPPEGWTPETWDDFPPSGVVLNVTPEAFRSSDAEILIYSWNRLSLDTGKGWAVPVPEKRQIQPGQTCERRLPAFA